MEGYCGDENITNSQMIRLNFFDGWKLEFNFTKKDKTYSVSRVALTYIVTKEYFPDVNQTGSKCEYIIILHMFLYLEHF